MSVKLLTEQHLEFLSFWRFYTCQNATLLEIACQSSFVLMYLLMFISLQEYCHVYSCTETTSVPCMPLSEAIRKGKTLKCEKPEKGCFVITFIPINPNQIPHTTKSTSPFSSF